MSTKISFGLSVREVRQAVKEVENYKKQLIYKTQIFAERLAEEGVYIARMQIAEYSAIDSGELVGSIANEYKGTTEKGASWVIYTNCPHAKYVEFGFGIMGLENPHPNTSIIGWKYDINEHGEQGWFYQKNGEWHWSKGQPSKPFMYLTAQELHSKVLEVAKDVFKS